MDVEYYGPNPQMGTWYLAALRATEEMARYRGEQEFADRCRHLFESGRDYLDSTLFNGDYYEHHIQPPRNAEAIAAGLRAPGLGPVNLDEPELQLGAACLVDQLVGQYLAQVCGLGSMVAPDNARTTLESIYRYNFKEDLHGHFNHLRTFALADEPAVLMATYPRGRRPERPFPYCNEVMTGFEYTAAVGMMYEGLTAQGVRIVEAIRSRYDGERRSPFDEAECGHHYARAMASWAAILALTGFHYSAVSREMTVAAAAVPTRWFFSTGNGWGTITQEPAGETTRVDIDVLGGSVDLAVLTLTGYGSSPVETSPLVADTRISVRVDRAAHAHTHP